MKMISRPRVTVERTVRQVVNNAHQPDLILRWNLRTSYHSSPGWGPRRRLCVASLIARVETSSNSLFTDPTNSLTSAGSRKNPPCPTENLGKAAEFGLKLDLRDVF